jgi:hypothetical protein
MEQASRAPAPHLHQMNPQGKEEHVMAESLGWVWVLTLALLIFGAQLSRHPRPQH